MENQRFVEIDDVQVLVNEDVYRAYKRPLWAESKRMERSKRCRNENGFRCTKDCRSCPKTRNGGVLSLDKLSESGFDLPDQIDIGELVADKLLLEMLAAALDDLEPDEKALINALFYQGNTERDYAAEVGISHQAVGKHKRKIIEKLRGLMGTDKK